MSINELYVPGDVVVWEEDAFYSRDKGTIGGSSATILVGTVLEKSGEDYIPCSTEANAVAIALANGTTGDVLPILVRTAVVNLGGLDGTGITLAEVIAPLAVKGIIVRTPPVYTTL